MNNPLESLAVVYSISRVANFVRTKIHPPKKQRVSNLESHLLGQLHHLGFKRYHDYLASPHWHNVKTSLQRSRPWKCYVCAKAGKIIIHHRTYARLGKERGSDLVLLCHGCHQETHAIAKRTGNLMNAHEVLKRSKTS